MLRTISPNSSGILERFLLSPESLLRWTCYHRSCRRPGVAPSLEAALAAHFPDVAVSVTAAVPHPA